MKPWWWLVLALVVACAQPQQPPPAYYGDPYARPLNVGGPGGGYMCTDLATASTRGSMCFRDPGRCEEERQRAAADGTQAEACRPQAPVACFQLGNDPDPSAELCAASVEDCELLRLIDKDKHGVTGGACDWRHGPGRERE